jgi:hypothetical protein
MSPIGYGHPPNGGTTITQETIVEPQDGGRTTATIATEPRPLPAQVVKGFAGVTPLVGLLLRDNHHHPLGPARTTIDIITVKHLVRMKRYIVEGVMDMKPTTMEIPATMSTRHW